MALRHFVYSVSRVWMLPQATCSLQATGRTMTTYVYVLVYLRLVTRGIPTAWMEKKVLPTDIMLNSKVEVSKRQLFYHQTLTECCFPAHLQWHVNHVGLESTCRSTTFVGRVFCRSTISPLPQTEIIVNLSHFSPTRSLKDAVQGHSAFLWSQHGVGMHVATSLGLLIHKL